MTLTSIDLSSTLRLNKKGQRRMEAGKTPVSVIPSFSDLVSCPCLSVQPYLQSLEVSDFCIQSQIWNWHQLWLICSIKRQKNHYSLGKIFVSSLYPDRLNHLILTIKVKKGQIGLTRRQNGSRVMWIKPYFDDSIFSRASLEARLSQLVARKVATLIAWKFQTGKSSPSVKDLHCCHNYFDTFLTGNF